MLESTKTLNGSFGKLYHEGEWLSNYNKVEVNTDVNFEEIQRSGTRSIGHKATTTKTTGVISGYKVSTKLLDRATQVMDDKKGSFVTELIAQLADPDNPEMAARMYRIKGVQFSKIPFLNFEPGTTVKEEWPFVADSVEPI